jgi:hypothetical protein
MKRFLTHSMFAAATLVAVAGSSSAQSLKAEIPFAFRAGAVLMQPGTYDVVARQGMSSMLFELHNRDTRQSVVLFRQGTRDVAKAWASAGMPRMAFQCAGSNCALSELWTGSEASSLFSSPKNPSGDPVRIAEVRMTTKAD